MALFPFIRFTYWFSFIAAFLLGNAMAAGHPITTLNDLRAARAEMAAKPRRLIANNDGCDALYFPKEMEPTVQNFLERRTTSNTWGANPEEESIVEARLRVESGVHHLSVSNGVGNERLEISPEGISLFNQKTRYAMDTTDDFHNYRVVLKGDSLKVYVDDVLHLDAPQALAARADKQPTRNELSFGEAPGKTHGAALWDEVKYRTAGNAQLFQDLVVDINYRKK